MAAGQQGVEIPIVAKLSGFEAAFQQIATQAAAASGRIRASFKQVSGAMAAVGVSVSVGGLALFVKNTIDAADHLNDLSKRTGVAVETLGGIGFAAEQAGGSLDEAAQAFGKFNLIVAKGAAGDKEAARAFQLLGVSIRDLQSKSPDELLAKVADAFADFDDGPNKAALANAVFGKSYAGILPLLDEGGEALQKNIDYYKKYSGVTNDFVKDADALNDTLVKLKLLNQQFGVSLAKELLPSLQKLSEAFVDSKEKGDTFHDFATIGANALKGYAIIATAAATEVAALADAFSTLGAQASAALKGNFDLVRKLEDEATARQDKRFARMKDIIAAIAEPRSATPAAGSSGGGSMAAARAAIPPSESHRKGGSGGRRPAPSLGSGDADASDRKALEGRLKALDDFVKEEQEVLRDREHFLAAYYQDDKMGIEEYFATRQTVIQDALAAQLAAYDEQARELRVAQAKSGDPKERIEYETKIADVVAKRSAAEREASVKLADGFIDSARAADAFLRKVEQIAIDLAEMKGDSVVAGLARFDAGNADLRKQLEANATSADEGIARAAAIGLRSLQAQRSILASQLALNAATRDFGLIVDQVGNKQQAVSIAVQSGYMTEILGLQKLSEINRSRLEDLSRQIDLAAESAQALVEKMGTQSPEAQAALNFVDQLKLKYQELAQTGDLVARKFNEMASSSFSQLLQDLATKPKDAIASLKKFADDLGGKVLQTATDNLAQKAFGQGGPLSGFGDIFSSLFGGKDATGAAALTAAGTTLTTAGTLQTSAAAALSASAAALSAAAAALGAGGTGESVSGFFGTLASGFGGGGSAGGFDPSELTGTFADGGMPRAGWALVGEKGPELVKFRGNGERVYSNRDSAAMLGRGTTQNVNMTFNVPNTSSKPSTQQMAKRVLEQLRAGSRK